MENLTRLSRWILWRLPVMSGISLCVLGAGGCWVTESDLELWSEESCEQAWYEDADNDGFGRTERLLACQPPDGYVDSSGDCDDDDWTVNPEGVDIPSNGRDEDCDGVEVVASEDLGVFVAPSGWEGAAGTRSDPFDTLFAALEVAEETGRPVFVAEGDYPGIHQVPVSVFGGYDATTWERDPDLHPTRFTGSDVSTYAILLNPPQGRPVVLDGVHVENDYFDTTAETVVLVSEVVFTGNGNNCVYATGLFEMVRSRTEDCSTYVREGASAVLYRNEFQESALSTLQIDGQSTVVENVIQGGITISGESARIEGNSIESVTTGIRGDEGEVEIIDNQISARGPGISVSDGHYTILGNTIFSEGTPSSNSYGILAYGSEILVAGNHIDAVAGGSDRSYGVNLSSTSGVLANNIIRVGTFGGVAYAVYVAGYSHEVSLVGNTIHTGVGTSPGFAVVVNNSDQQMSLTAVNNVIYASETSNPAGFSFAFLDRGLFSARLVHNRYWGLSRRFLLNGPASSLTDEATAEQANNCLGWTDGCDEAWGNSEGEVQFVDLESWDAHLAPGSAAIDAGTNPLPYVDLPVVRTDIDGESRPAGDGWDQGADEFQLP